MGNAKKIIPEKRPEIPEDREQGLSNSFEDISLAELFPESEAEGAAKPELLAETAEALRELVREFNPSVSPPAAEPVNLGLELPEVSPAGGPIEIGLDVASEANRIFAQEEVFADASAVAIRQRLGDLFLDLVACDRSFNALVDSILAILMEATGAEAGSVLELDQEKLEFFFRASRGGDAPEKLKAFRVPMNQGIVGQVAQTREPLFIRDMADDRRELLAISASVGLDTKSCLAAPILIQGQVFGVIELFNKTPGALFNQDDFAVLKRGAQMAAKVLEVRFLTAELARRAG